MSFHKSVKAMINRYGTDVTVLRNGEITATKGFVQPLRHQTRVYSDMSIGIGGFKDARYYLYIGRPDVSFVRGDNTIITCFGEQYVVHTSECYKLSDKPLYVWAVLTPHTKRRVDDYDSDRN